MAESATRGECTTLVLFSHSINFAHAVIRKFYEFWCAVNR